MDSAKRGVPDSPLGPRQRGILNEGDQIVVVISRCAQKPATLEAIRRCKTVSVNCFRSPSLETLGLLSNVTCGGFVASELARQSAKAAIAFLKIQCFTVSSFVACPIFASAVTLW